MPKFPLFSKKEIISLLLTKSGLRERGLRETLDVKKKKIRHLVFKFFEVNFTMARIFLSDKVIN